MRMRMGMGMGMGMGMDTPVIPMIPMIYIRIACETMADGQETVWMRRVGGLDGWGGLGGVGKPVDRLESVGVGWGWVGMGWERMGESPPPQPMRTTTPRGDGQRWGGEMGSEE